MSFGWRWERRFYVRDERVDVRWINGRVDELWVARLLNGKNIERERVRIKNSRVMLMTLSSIFFQYISQSLPLSNVVMILIAQNWVLWLIRTFQCHFDRPKDSRGGRASKWISRKFINVLSSLIFVYYCWCSLVDFWVNLSPFVHLHLLVVVHDEQRKKNLFHPER